MGECHLLVLAVAIALAVCCVADDKRPLTVLVAQQRGTVPTIPENLTKIEMPLPNVEIESNRGSRSNATANPPKPMGILLAPDSWPIGTSG